MIWLLFFLSAVPIGIVWHVVESHWPRRYDARLPARDPLLIEAEREVEEFLNPTLKDEQLIGLAVKQAQAMANMHALANDSRRMRGQVTLSNGKVIQMEDAMSDDKKDAGVVNFEIGYTEHFDSIEDLIAMRPSKKKPRKGSGERLVVTKVDRENGIVTAEEKGKIT